MDKPWGERRYIEDIETREDGGTPGFLQCIKTALCIELKDKMGVQNMHIREKELMNILFKELSDVKDYIYLQITFTNAWVYYPSMHLVFILI